MNRAEGLTDALETPCQPFRRRRAAWPPGRLRRRTTGAGEGQLYARKHARQPKPWQHGVVEVHQRADPSARQGEDQQAGGPADLTMRVMDVEPEGGLTIRPRGDQPEGASGRSDTILRKLAASSRP